MKVIIVIDGESADELFAVGPEDMKNHLLPKRLKVKPEDVARIYFEEMRKDGKVLTDKRERIDAICKGGYETTTHQDNFERDK